MKSKVNINFHQTFYSNLEYISKILNFADYDGYFLKEEISEITGIPTGKISGKVVPHIEYCKYMNLIRYDLKKGAYKITRTELGELVYKEDPYIDENITKFLCHYFLTSYHFGAPMWFDIYRRFQNDFGSEISINIVDSELEKKNKSKIKLNPFNGCYINIHSFIELNLINITKEMYIFTEFKYSKNYFYAILYCLIRELEELDSNRIEFTEWEVFNEILWQKSLNWSTKKGMDLIELAVEKGYIGLNKQLTPITLLINRKSKDILKDVYSSLL